MMIASVPQHDCVALGAKRLVVFREEQTVGKGVSAFLNIQFRQQKR